MATANNKTQATKLSVIDFLEGLSDEDRKKDCLAVLKIMEKVTGAKAKMWGSAIIGFGDCHLKYESGRELDWFLVGFSPRKQNLTLYIMSGFKGYDELMKKLGKFKTSSSCIYVNKLSDIDEKTLYEIIELSVDYMRKKYKA
jgi:hypothetical protein